MPYDTVIKGGTVIDGTGGPARRADVGVTGGRIVEIGSISSRSTRVVDAEGLVVTPGFIDGHTHMDAQLMWNGLGESSCWHGVTTVVMGNTGFTLAPVRADRTDLVVRNLERAEDIPAAAMSKGIEWEWEGFTDYLDVVDTKPKGINYATYVGHSALRTWAMGERAFDQEANAEDLARMQDELRRALGAGAVGLSTSRSLTHQTADDRPVASRVATWDELRQLVGVVGDFGGTLELAVDAGLYGPDPAERRRQRERLLQLTVETRAAVCFGLLYIPSCPEQWSEALELCDAATAAGGSIFGQAHSRAITVLMSFRTRLPFDHLPGWKELRAEPIERQHQLLSDPDLRARLVAEADQASYTDGIGAEMYRPDYDLIQVLDRALPPNPTVADVARRRGVHPVEAMILEALDTGMDRFFAEPHSNRDPDAALAILRHPETVLTFSDAGAHVSQIMDTSIHTYFLAHWVRERQAFTLEEAVRMITSVPAMRWHLHDRGLVKVGYVADLTLFDPTTVAPAMPTVHADLPGGAQRLEQHAEGIRATMVGGEVLTEEGKHTGAMPGRLLRQRVGQLG